MQPLCGALALTPDDEGAIVLRSPRDLALAAAMLTFVVGVTDDAVVRVIAIDAQAAPDAPWRPLAPVEANGALRTTAGHVLDCVLPDAIAPIDALRVTLVVSSAAVTLERVAILCAP
jgi:hypothetical protein